MVHSTVKHSSSGVALKKDAYLLSKLRTVKNHTQVVKDLVTSRITNDNDWMISKSYLVECAVCFFIILSGSGSVSLNYIG